MKLRIVKPFMAVNIMLLAAALFVARPTQANPLEEAQISLQPIESGKKAIVKIWNLPEAHSAIVKVLNSAGKLVYKESFNSAAYAKKFDFSMLPAGQYKVILQSGTHAQSETFEVLDNGNILVIKDAADNNFKPIVKIHEGKQVDVLIENRYAQPLNITLKNQKGEIAYHEQLAPNGNMARRLNLKDLPKDNYSLSVAGNGIEYAQDINLF